jgi:hypothetical protein
LFGEVLEARSGRWGTSQAMPRWVWLAPALACFVLGLMVWRSPMSDPGAERGWRTNSLAVSAAISNQTLALLAPMSNIEHNHFVRGTFEWTNAGASTSSTGHLQQWVTNRLLSQ